MGEITRKTFITFITAVFMMFALSSTAYAAKQPVIHVAINNEILLYPQDAQPYIDIKGNVFVPLFVTGEKLGASVEWGENQIR